MRGWPPKWTRTKNQKHRWQSQQRDPNVISRPSQSFPTTCFGVCVVKQRPNKLNKITAKLNEKVLFVPKQNDKRSVYVRKKTPKRTTLTIEKKLNNNLTSSITIQVYPNVWVEIVLDASQISSQQSLTTILNPCPHQHAQKTECSVPIPDLFVWLFLFFFFFESVKNDVEKPIMAVFLSIQRTKQLVNILMDLPVLKFPLMPLWQTLVISRTLFTSQYDELQGDIQGWHFGVLFSRKFSKLNGFVHIVFFLLLKNSVTFRALLKRGYLPQS